MINVQISNLWSLKIEELDWDAFCANWPLAKGDKPEKAYSIDQGPTRVSFEEAQNLAALGITLEVVPLPGMMVAKQVGKNREWAYGETPHPADVLEGKAVQITLPDVGLLLIDEVSWLDDACTQEVQRMLDEGWRILAVCPPNAQRRPDYIFGRRKRDNAKV